MPHPELVAAVNCFADWGRPWLFDGWVKALLSPAHAALFDQVWQEAMRAAHWVEPLDLNAGANRASAALAERFPWLSAEAITAVTNAAAYQWR